MKKRLGAALLSTLAITLMVGVFSRGMNNKYQQASAIEEEVEEMIDGVQVRSTLGDGGTNENYIVIQDRQIEISYQPERTGWTMGYTAPSKIKVYLSATDEGHYLSEIINNDYWTLNRWECYGVMFPLDDAAYENTYNGSSIYMIEILEGCTYPNNKSQKVIVNETKRFMNLNYGSSEATIKYGAYEWAEDSNYEKGDISLDIFRGEIRCDTLIGKYYIDLGCELFLPEAEKYYINLGTKINAYEKIIIYTSETSDGIPLSEVTPLRTAVINKWSSQGFMFDLTASAYDTYNGTTIHHIKVLQDCELIYQDKICTVSKPLTLTNYSYGDPAARNEVVLMPFEPVEPLDEPISLIGAQVRGDAGDHLYFIDIMSDIFIGLDEFPYTDLSSINAYTHINIYLSEDSSPIALSNVTSLREGCQNKWEGGQYFMFALTEAEYEIYNGTTIYMIEVLKDCEVYVDRALAKIDKTYRFINPDWGKANAKYEAFNFSLYATDLTNFGEFNIIGIHNRMDSPNKTDPNCLRWMMFLFEERVYATNMVVNSWIDKLNLLDNVLIYPEKDAEPYTLRSIFNPSGSGIQIKQFGELNMMGISISNEKSGDSYLYDGPHMYSVVFNAGTQIPSYENGETGYRVISEKTMVINNEYGLTGPIPNSIDEYKNLRLYEEWNLNWSVIRCMVSFRVVGIEGLIYPDMYLQTGEYYFLDHFKQDGYDLEATTESGDHIYNAIVGINKNIKVVLTYTPAQEKEKSKKGCGGAITSMTIIVPAMVVSALAVLLILRRKGIKYE